MQEASAVHIKVTLADKIRKSREFEKTIGGFNFTLRRPTDVEWYEVVCGTGSVGRFLQFIIGWSNVKQSDALPNGDPHWLEFDEDVRDVWLADRADLLGPLVDAIFENWNAHKAKRDAEVKN